jgi:hypothetical protein
MEDLSDLGTPAEAAPEAPSAPTPDVDTHIDALISQESGGNPKAVGDSGLALGLGQMHPEVRRAYNVAPNSTPDQQRAAIKSYYTDLLKKHGGNVDDALSEYHLGATRYAKERTSPDNLAYLEKHHQKVAARTGSSAAPGGGEDLSDLGTPVDDTGTAAEPDYASDPRFNTQLSPDEEQQFQAWKAQNAPKDSGADYDLRGAFKAGLQPGANGHWADTYKKPNHPTFSDQSQYAKLAPEKAGRWDGDTYIPPRAQNVSDTTPPPDEASLTATPGAAETLTSAAKDFITGVSNISHPQGFTDALNSFLGIIHPLSVGGEVAADYVYRAGRAMGMSYNQAHGLATMADTAVNMAIPIPGTKAAEAMPLLGTKATREAASEAAGAAERGAQWASTARDVGREVTGAAQREAERVAAKGTEATAAAAEEASRVAERGAQWTGAAKSSAVETANAASAEADRAAEAARVAAERAAPSTDAAARAKAALTPAGVSAEQGGQAIKTGLESELAQQKASTGGIYDAYAETHGRDPVMDPKRQRELLEMIQGAKADLGVTLTGAPKTILDDLEAQLTDTLKGAQPMNVADFNKEKTKLDGLLRGGAKTQKNTTLNQINMKIRDIIRGGASGDDADWLAAADHLWKTELAGREMTSTSLGKIAKLVKSKDPKVIVDKLFGTGTTADQGAMAQAIMKHLDRTESATSEVIRQANFDNLFRPDAEGNLDPKELLKRYDDWHTGFRDAMNTPGAETFFKVERQMQKEAETAATAAKGAAKTAKGVEKGAAASVEEAESTTAKGTAAAQKAAKQTEAQATKATKEAQARAADVAAGAEKATTTAANIAERAKTDAAAAAEAAKSPNKLAKMTARGLKFTGAGLTEALAHHLGISPYLASPAAVAEMLIPTDHLARLLANSKTANILARALKTPVNSMVVPALLQELRATKLGKSLLASPEGQQKQREATDTMTATATP